MVSVVMPVFNGERFVDEAIRSILVQTLSDFEFIIVDDGSTDSTPGILDEHVRHDSRIRVIRQSNAGVTAALNAGCTAAGGEYIARMDADDVSLPQRLEVQVAYLATHPRVTVLGSAIQVIDQAGQKSGIKRFPTTPGLVAWSMLFFNSVVHPAVLMRRDALAAAGFYPAHRPRVEDYALFLRLSRTADIDNLQDVLLNYRIWPGSVSVTGSEEQERSARDVLLEHLTEITGREITATEAGTLRGLSTDRYPDDVDAIVKVSDLICELVAAQERRREDGSSAAVRRDAAVRLWLLSMLAARQAPGLGASIAWRASRMSPRAFPTFIAKVGHALTR